MNCYFLVEGKETESKLYPRLISHFIPQYKEVKDVNDLTSNSYCIFSGYGYPSIVKERLHGTLRLIKDINSKSKHTNVKIDALIIVIDADVYRSYDSAKKAMEQKLKNVKSEIKEAHVTVYTIIQNRCIESWLLANETVFPVQYDNDFKEYVDYYDVRKLDPEKMVSNDQSITDGQYAYNYLTELVCQGGRHYSKSNIDDVSTKEGFESIFNRFKNGHIQSFKSFWDVIQKMKKRLTI